VNPGGIRSSVDTISEKAVVVTTLRYTTGWTTYIIPTVKSLSARRSMPRVWPALAR
jgi:hypothetical protein